jgi:hypothetical protein
VLQHEHRGSPALVPELPKRYKLDSQIRAEGMIVKIVGFILRLVRATIDARSTRPEALTITTCHIVQDYIH